MITEIIQVKEIYDNERITLDLDFIIIRINSHHNPFEHLTRFDRVDSLTKGFQNSFRLQSLSTHSRPAPFNYE